MRVSATNQHYYYSLRKKSLDFGAVVNVWFIFIFIFLQTDWSISLSTNRVRQTMIHVEDKIYSGSGTNRCSAFLTTKLRIRTRIQTLKRKTGKLLFRDSFSVQFMLRAVCGRKFSRQKT